MKYLPICILMLVVFGVAMSFSNALGDISLSLNDTIVASSNSVEQTVERNDSKVEVPVVIGPVNEIPYVESDIEYLDTLCMANSKAVSLDYDLHAKFTTVLIGRNKIIQEPILRFDSLAPSKYRISDVCRSIDVDFTKATDIEALKRFNKPLTGFAPYFKNYTRTVTSDYETVGYCAFYVDFPDESIKNADLINKWLVSVLNAEDHWGEECGNYYSKYNGSASNKNAIARYCADRFFAYSEQEWSTVFYVFDMRAKVKTDRYVTYQRYTHNYQGGAHGYYTERIISFDIENNQPIDENYLFKKSQLNKVKEVLLHTAMTDKNYCYWENTNSYDDVLANFQPKGSLADQIIRLTGREDDDRSAPTIDNVHISDIGITPKGVVISYQPYDISCFAAGCFHFLIPYSKLLPYMTDKAKRCVGLQ